MVCLCSPASAWFRKWFHLFALLIFVPGIAMDPELTTLASTTALAGFLLVEVGWEEGRRSGRGKRVVCMYMCL